MHAQEQEIYEDISNDSSSSEDDGEEYQPRSYYKRKHTHGGKGNMYHYKKHNQHGGKPTPTPTSFNKSNKHTRVNKTNGATKRKYYETGFSTTPSTKRRKRGWDTDEELKFEEGLELYGRDWKSLSLHVGGNRNEAAIRSHAQIYFLKLLQQRKQLPDAVKKSGCGYTLSGAKLNKYAATVKKVFGNPEQVPMDLGGVISDKEAAEKAKFKNKSGGYRYKKYRKKSVTSNYKKKKIKTKTKNKNTKNKNKNNKNTSGCNIKIIDDDDDDDDNDNDQDEYIPPSDHDDIDDDDDLVILKNKNKNIQMRSVVVGDGVGDGNNRVIKQVHQHMTHGQHISNLNKLRNDIRAFNKQEYSVNYCSNGLLVSYLHSHIFADKSCCGLLLGNCTNNVVNILKCYPLFNDNIINISHLFLKKCKQIKHENDNNNNNNIGVIGWYISHPKYSSYPSNYDLQRHYQLIQSQTQNIPFIGLIISSWSKDCIECEYRFYSCIRNKNNTDFIPLQYNTKPILYNDISDAGLYRQMEALIRHYTAMEYNMYRIDLGCLWKKDNNNNKIKYTYKSNHDIDIVDDNSTDTDIDNKGNPNSNMSFKDKIFQSLRLRMNSNNNSLKEDSFIHRIEDVFKNKLDIWWRSNKPLIINSYSYSYSFPETWDY